MKKESKTVDPETLDNSPKLDKGKFLVNFPKAISQFENAMHKFPVKKILYKVIFRGRGLEFDSYRTFNPDDDAKMIDWMATLRANEILAKKYIEERDLNIYFLVDVSNSMLFGSGNKLKAEYVAELIISLSHLIINSGDKIGLIMFNDNVIKILRSSKQKNQFGLFIKFLSDPNLYGGKFDLNKAIDYAIRITKSPYTVFILISDFIKIKKNSARGLRLLGSKFETLAIMVRDKMDENLPETKYQFSIQDPYSGKQMILDPSIAAKKYNRNAIKQKKLIKKMFEHSKIDSLEITTDKNFSIPVSNFLKKRATETRI